MPCAVFRRAVILIDHGSRRAEANAMLEQVAEMLRQSVPQDVFVTFAHMELAKPDLGEAIERCVAEGVDSVMVHPYMLSPGRHANHDIPKMVDELARHHESIAFQVTEALGLHPGLIAAVKERCGL